MRDKSRRGWTVYERTSSLSIPAIRMVVVAVWLGEGEDNAFECEICPVVGIETTISDHFRFRREGAEPDEYYLPAIVDRLQEKGWEFEFSITMHLPIVLDYKGDLVGIDQLSEYAECRAVVCTWPIEDDYEKLKRVIDQCREEYIRKNSGNLESDS